ncbi:MAG: IPTL-CTERM sorting domain-containing protein [Deltaproteobacteria bacterium]|nr:IPTL-CTERM sorting domain-containing protein [Deltaproteobacteria bacterium]
MRYLGFMRCSVVILLILCCCGASQAAGTVSVPNEASDTGFTANTGQTIAAGVVLVPPGATNTPTLSEWGMIIFGVMLAVWGIAKSRKREDAV